MVLDSKYYKKAANYEENDYMVSDMSHFLKNKNIKYVH